MAADAGIFQQYLNPVRSVADYRGDMDKQEQNMLTLAAGRLSSQQAQQAQADDQALRRATIMGGGDSKATLNAIQKAGLFKEAQAFQRSTLDTQKVQSGIDVDKAHSSNWAAQTAKTEFETKKAKTEYGIQRLTGVLALPSITDADIANMAHDFISYPGADPKQVLAGVAGLPPESDQVGRRRALEALLRGNTSAAEQMKYQAPDANAVLTAQTSTDNNKATNDRVKADAAAGRAVTMRGQNMVDERAKADSAVEAPENIEKMAKGIASGRLAPMSSFAMLKPSGKAIMSRVLDINPTYDAGDYLSKNKALRDYGTGTQGLAVQAANTGLNHLDTIEELALAQKNGDKRMFNAIANRLAAETGSAAPTNLAAAISMVAPEVSKMVIGAAGGQEERATFAHNFNPNASPEQTLGGIRTMRELLAGRLTEAERTYKRTTGRTDFSDGMLSPAAQKVLATRSSTAHAAPPVSANSVLSAADAILKGHK